MAAIPPTGQIPHNPNPADAGSFQKVAGVAIAAAGLAVMKHYSSYVGGAITGLGVIYSLSSTRRQVQQIVADRLNNLFNRWVQQIAFPTPYHH